MSAKFFSFCIAPVALVAASVTNLSAQTTGDAVRGAKLFLQCRACHTIGVGEASGVGPNLNGVFGAKAASRADYKYSPALAASGLAWTSDNLNLWLQEPTGLVSGTKMAFAGVKDAKSRQDIIAYLATLTPKK